MKEIIQVRIWNPEENKYEYSGGTPSMMSIFYRRTAKLFTFHNQEYEYATGLKDKNDKEIWEGDSVKGINGFGEQEKTVVEYRKGGYYPLREGEFYWTEIEVIGNIHSNPELLLDLNYRRVK